MTRKELLASAIVDLNRQIIRKPMHVAESMFQNDIRAKVKAIEEMQKENEELKEHDTRKELMIISKGIATDLSRCEKRRKELLSRLDGIEGVIETAILGNTQRAGFARELAQAIRTYVKGE